MHQIIISTALSVVIIRQELCCQNFDPAANGVNAVIGFQNGREAENGRIVAQKA